MQIMDFHPQLLQIFREIFRHPLGKRGDQDALTPLHALADLPEPLDPRVRFREVPPRRLAARAYSGGWSTSRYEEELARLRAALAREGLAAAGEPVWARFDPPFKPWFLRTNEIWIEVAR